MASIRTDSSAASVRSRKRTRFADPPLQAASDKPTNKRAKSDKISNRRSVHTAQDTQQQSIAHDMSVLPIQAPSSSPPARSRMQTSFASHLVLDDFCIERLSAPSTSEIGHLVARCKDLAIGQSAEAGDTKAQMYVALPSREHAVYLCEQANVVLLCHGFLPQQHEDLLTTINVVYDADHSQACPFRLSAVFAVLALGMEASSSDDVVSDSAGAYHLLARAAACLPSDSSDGGYSFLTATVFMLTYMLTFREDETNLRAARNIMDASARVCEKLGLKADVPARQRFSGQKLWRRVMFWQLMSCDLTIALLRLDETSLPMQEPDNRYALTENTSGPTACLEWRQQCLTRCATPILKLIRTTTPLPAMYMRVLKLDVTMRDYPVPTAFRLGIHCSGPSASKQLTVMRAFYSLQRDVLIIRLHHAYFMQTLETPSFFSYSHPHIASVLATYQSACQIIACLALVFRCQPEACQRIPCLWTQAFAAVTSLCKIVTQIPGDALATLSRPQIDKCMDLLRKIKGARAQDSEKMDMLDGLTREAAQMYTHWQQSSIARPWPSPAATSTPSSESSSTAHADSSLALMHPILLRLLQQIKTRAQAVQSMSLAGAETLVPQAHTLPAFGVLPPPSAIEEDQRLAVPTNTWDAAPSNYLTLSLDPPESTQFAAGHVRDPLFPPAGDSWGAFEGATAAPSFDTTAGGDWATMSLPSNIPPGAFPSDISHEILSSAPNLSRTFLNTQQHPFASDRIFF